MPIATDHGVTPFTTNQLQTIYSLASGSRARDRQNAVDRIIVEVFGPLVVGKRADRAAAMIAARVGWLHTFLTSGQPGVEQHVGRLIRQINDRAAAGRLATAAKRLPAGRQNRNSNIEIRKSERATA